MRSAWFINPPFAMLWLGQSISQLGDAVLEVTLPLWVSLLTHTPSQVAGVAITEVLPALCLGPFAGVVADRWNPRRLMVACDLLRGLLIGLLLLAPASALPEAIYGVSFATAVLGNLFNPARSVSLRLVVPDAEMTRAQALARITQSGALILGPVLGAALLFWGGPASGLLVDALSFGLGAAALLLLPSRSPSPRASGRSHWGVGQTLWRDMRAGMGYTIHRQPLITLMVVQCVLAVVGSLWYAVDVFFVEHSLGLPAASVGLLWTLSGCGGLLGGVLVVVAAKRARQEFLLLFGLFLRGGSLFWYALMTSCAWALPAAALAGMGEAFVSVALASLLMERTNSRFLGRVTALFDTTSQLATLLALLAVGVLSQWLSPWQLLVLCSLFVLLASLSAFLRLKPRRRVAA